MQLIHSLDTGLTIFFAQDLSWKILLSLRAQIILKSHIQFLVHVVKDLIWLFLVAHSKVTGLTVLWICLWVFLLTFCLFLGAKYVWFIFEVLLIRNCTLTYLFLVSLQHNGCVIWGLFFRIWIWFNLWSWTLLIDLTWILIDDFVLLP